MASAQEIAQRTEEYRLQQVRLGNALAATAAQETVSWLNEGIDAGFPSFLEQIITLIQGGRRTAYLDALLYYQDIRKLHGIAGDMPDVREPEFPNNEVMSSIVWTGPRYAKSLIAREQTQNLSQVVGASVGRAVMKHSLNAGRTTMMKAVPADKKAVGWKRITDADPCSFCEMLAGRGAVYKSARTAGNELNRYHDGCACSVVPVFKS